MIADCSGLIELRAVGVAPGSNAEVPLHTGEDTFLSLDQKFAHISTTPTTRGRKRTFPGSILSRSVWRPQSHLVIADCPGLMDPTRGECCPSVQRRGPAAHGEDKVPSPGGKFAHIYNPKILGTKTTSPRSKQPRNMCKPQSRWAIADCPGLMETARGECCPLVPRRGPAAHGEDKFPSPGQKVAYIYTTQNVGDENAQPPGRYRPGVCGNPNPTG